MNYLINYLLILLFSLIGLNGSAQKDASQKEDGMPLNFDFFQQNECPDTIINFFEGATPAIYPSPNGGFVNGNNGYADTEKLQLFNHSQNYSIKGVLVWFGRKITTSGNDASSIQLFVRHTDSTASTTPPFIKGPSDSLLASKSFPLSTIVASNFPAIGLNYLEFDNPVLIRDGYSVGIGLTNLAPGDTIAVYSSSNGDPILARRSWEKWDGIYGSIFDSWELNIDLAIFPVVDCELNNIGSAPLRKETFQVYPNPAHQQITIPKLSDKSCKITVINASGKVVNYVESVSNAEEAKLEIRNLADGIYYITVDNGEKMFSSLFLKISP